MNCNIFFTSDTHFHHTNVIKYCTRPFTTRKGDEIIPDVNWMNREMTRRWNEAVSPLDTVYHLGDFAMGSSSLLAPTRRKLNGKIILIKGNHDRSVQALLNAGFDQVYNQLNMELDGVKLYLHHQPEVKERWNQATIHLCGHVHEKWRRKGNMINVGVDQWDFTPRTLKEILAAEKQGVWPTPEEME